MAEAGCSDGALFKKRVIKNRGGRKRKNSSSEKDSAESDQDGPTVVVPSRRHKKENPNIQSTGNRNKAHTRKDSDNSSEEGEQFGVTYRSKGVELTHGDQNATATYEFDTEKDRDAQAIFEKALAVNQELEGQADDKIYRGINNYAMYYKKRDTAAGNASSGLVRQGPIRAPANLRATVRWDYQPDICKDYKETGFCGFGDSCKFLHDRGDYKHGWQLERQEAAGGGGADDDDDDTRYEVDSDEEHLPFKCFICRNSFKQPVVTKCKHYFCESCALTNFKKSTRCFICNAQTGGVFNPAKELEARIQAQGAGPPSGDDDNDSD